VLQTVHLWLQAMGVRHALPAAAVPTMVPAQRAPPRCAMFLARNVMLPADSAEHE
jgi:hypothetical protein